MLLGYYCLLLTVSYRIYC